MRPDRGRPRRAGPGDRARWAEPVAPHVQDVKIGLELFCAAGPQVVEQVRARGRVFLDLKLHDIPNTVAGAARAVARLRPRFLTVHAAGGSAMMRAAVEAAPDATITAITVLTCLRRGRPRGRSAWPARRWTPYAVWPRWPWRRAPARWCARRARWPPYGPRWARRSS